MRAPLIICIAILIILFKAIHVIQANSTIVPGESAVKVSSGNITLKYNRPKIMISQTMFIVIKQEIGNNSMVLEASQMNKFSPLLKNNVARVVVNMSARWRSYPRSGVIVIFARPNEVKTLLQKSSFTDCKYILISDSILPLESCFKVFWKYKILNVIALVETKLFYKSIQVFTYKPFKSKCDDARPRLIGVSSGHKTNKSLFFDLSKLKFNNCNLTITVMHGIPDINITKNEVKVKGGLLKILRAVERHLEMGTKLWTGEELWDAESFSGSMWNQIPGYAWEVIKGRADFSFGRFSWMYHNYNGVGFPMQVGTECITWAVPYGAGPLPSSWLLFTYQFSLVTWLCIIFSFFLAGTFIAILDPVYNAPLLIAFKVLLGTGAKMPSKWHSKLFIFHWASFALVFGAAYQGLTGSLVLVPPESGNIATKEQVRDSDLILFVDFEMNKISEKLGFGAEYSDKVFIYPRDKFIQAMVRVYVRKDCAVMSSERTIRYAWSQLRRLTNDTHILSILPQCLFTSPTSIFLVRDGSYIEAPLHRSLRYLSEGGILQLWENVLEDDPPPRNFSQFKKDHPLSIHQTSGAFYILAVGYAIAGMVFICEQYIYKWTNMNRKFSLKRLKTRIKLV